MLRKRILLLASGAAVIAIVVLLIILTADQPAVSSPLGSPLGYSGPSISGKGAIAYMSVVGTSQGVIEGDVTAAGRKDTHAVFAIEHTIEIPRDSLTGQPTGARVHHPFVITTHLSPGTPKLNLMCTSGETAAITISYWRINDLGQEEHYYTVRLERALIVDLSHHKPLVFLPENEPYGDMVTIGFTYSEITWTHEIAGVVAEDSWRR